MLGRQHALAGTAAWLAVAPTLDLDVAQTALGAFVAAGTGMFPDLDQHGSHIGRTYGPVTNVLARAVGAIAQGHRNGTHSLLGIAVATTLAWLAVQQGGWLQFLLLWLLLGVAARAYGMRGPWPLYGLAMAGVTVAVSAGDVDLGAVLVLGMLLGCTVHVATDGLTRQGVPLLWPFSRRRYGVDLLSTDRESWRSKATTVVLTVAVAVLALV